MKKKIQRILALLLSAALLLGAAPSPGEESAQSQDIGKSLSREEDKSQLPQNSWTDVENMKYWHKLFAGVKLSGAWSEDLVHIALTQVGYRESTLNVRRDEEGMPQGYTRYGAWYGVPHGEWCAMFIAFCLYFARIPESSVPYEANCGRWEGALREKGLYNDSKSYVPQRGDLVFFGQRGIPAHVGIVLGINEWTGELSYIHGNAAEKDVAIDSIKLNHGTIVGYGMLPENPDYAK